MYVSPFSWNKKKPKSSCREYQLHQQLKSMANPDVEKGGSFPLTTRKKFEIWLFTEFLDIWAEKISTIKIFKSLLLIPMIFSISLWLEFHNITLISHGKNFYRWNTYERICCHTFDWPKSFQNEFSVIFHWNGGEETGFHEMRIFRWHTKVTVSNRKL